MLRVPRTVYDEMVAHAVAEYPRECCGFLTGTNDPDSWRGHRGLEVQ